MEGDKCLKDPQSASGGKKDKKEEEEEEEGQGS